MASGVVNADHFQWAMEVQEAIEIPVWVEGTQKWVTGLTKRTTCDDVIYALLYQEGKQDHDSTDNYTMYERWRDVERPLQGRTKIIKIWRAWGAEQYNVQLTMKHNKESDDYAEFLHHRRRNHRRSRHKTRTERSSRSRSDNDDKYQSTNDRLKTMENLAKLVITQERKLYDIHHCIKDTDKRIDGIETDMHYTRMAENGQDYLQNAYLENGLEDSMDEFMRNVDPDNLEMYIQFCERVINLESRIQRETSKIEDLSLQIQESSHNEAFYENIEAAKNGGNLEVELANLQADLNRMVSANMMQKYQAAQISKEIEQCDHSLTTKLDTISQLQKELEALDNSYVTHKDDVSNNVYSVEDAASNYLSVVPENHSTPLRNQYYEEAEYVNLDSIIGMSHSCDPDTSADTRDTGKGDSFDSGCESNRKQPNTSDLDDSFSGDTDNTSSDSHFGQGSQTPSNSVAKYSCRNYSRLPERSCREYSRVPTGHATYQCDELISERIKSEIYVYKSARTCYMDKHMAFSGYRSEERQSYRKSEEHDSNSDTGLSSLHSDESPTSYLETLV
ncbi:ras association domain-containing protein 10-like isoform X3 [Pecten maximus]|nr:ras association domain-containing protein 10-like isoform X3 [Pecten maximus]